MRPNRNPHDEHTLTILGKHLKCAGDEAFRDGSSAKYDAKFSGSQSWVKSSAKEFRLQTSSRRATQRIALADEASSSTTNTASHPAVNNNGTSSEGLEFTPGGLTYFNPTNSSSLTPSRGGHSQPSALPAFETQPAQHPLALSQRGPSWGGLLHALEPPHQRDLPLEGVQEACLLRYFIEELSHWFDLVDPQRRYQLVVPERARRYPPLLNAILAMSARHLCRVEKYKTTRGIVYRGQPLPNLSSHSAVEYMLKCIPVLKDFHTTEDGETRELIVTTAVILRHFEELDDEDEDPALDTRPDEGVNFLAILNAVLRSLTSDDLINRRELLIASYWVALRQEVYYALRKGYPAQMVEPPAEWSDISPANRIVFHTSQVTKWLFDDKSESGWRESSISSQCVHLLMARRVDKLKEQEEYLDQYVTGRFEPILHRPPDRALGEVFPTMWYASPIALTGMQHMMIAKMILTAESPLLSQAEDVRAAYRKAEGEVRNLVLQVCGTAVQHPDTQPGLVNAILAIQISDV
ncbi:ARCA-like protein [Fusarium pseudoanthophilum]|uniref:ARCA-like protein n=1 Tax=Fusarium pseudoanthophilum TaxID=48495 RepID=A0A8H5P5B4_9HYPO|nr:ARCA-like protein [Fusarium pseudoanthophilum]